jgi:hypothetical protein
MGDFEEQLTEKLESRFPEDKSDIPKVVERVKEAQDHQYTDHLDLDEVESVITGIENWSQDQGLTAGWNRWITVGVPDHETGQFKI